MEIKNDCIRLTTATEDKKELLRNVFFDLEPVARCAGKHPDNFTFSPKQLPGVSVNSK